MSAIYNYTNEDLILFEIDWGNETITGSYKLKKTAHIKLDSDTEYDMDDNTHIKIYNPLILPEPRYDTIYIVDENICKMLGSLRPDLRYPAGKIVDPTDSSRYGYSLLFGYDQ